MAFDAARLGRATAAVQGIFYVLTGLWPLLHLESFLLVTGPKEDLWLVQTVGAVVLAVGLGLVTEALLRADPGPSVRVLGAASAMAFIAVDLVFYLDGRIGSVYLLDAAAEGVLLLGWAVSSLPTARRIRAGAT